MLHLGALIDNIESGINFDVVQHCICWATYAGMHAHRMLMP